jgi:methylglutamate dehydrogenase subunit D
MVELVSPLGAVWTPGRFGAPGPVGVTLSELQCGSIVQLAAWPGSEGAALDAIRAVTGLTFDLSPNAGATGEGASAFGFAPGRFLVVDEAEARLDALASAFPKDAGTVLDLSHGRVGIGVEGPKAEWVLSKLFGLDFRQAAFPLGAGKATSHHDISALIQRAGERRFDIYVFRSFARSFWKTLCHAAAETGYEVA